MFERFVEICDNQISEKQNYQIQIQMHIEVQCCVDCHLHNWCSRHNQAKYHEFYDKLEAKARSISKNITISKNETPQHLQRRVNLSNSGLGLYRYFDQKRDEVVIFPRHGAFQVKVNGMLIFSKLQSNLWPNIQKLGYLLSQISSELAKGGDIKKYSLEYRLQNENDDQYFVDTYKKVIKFKINRRPHSSQFNQTSYISKGSVQQSSDLKQMGFKRRNVVSVKKTSQDKLENSRKTQFQRRPIPRLKQRKGADHNQFNDFPEGQLLMDDHYNSPNQNFSKAFKSQKFSPRARRLILKKQLAGPLKPIPIESPPAVLQKQPIKLLEKKPSRKLVIKANQKKSQDNSGKKEQIKRQIGITDQVEQSESVLIADHVIVNKKEQKKDQIKQTPKKQFGQQPKKQEKLKPVIIQVKKQQQKPLQVPKIQKIITIQKTQKQKPSHHKQQSSNGEYEDLMNELQSEDKQKSDDGKKKLQVIHPKQNKVQNISKQAEKHKQSLKSQKLKLQEIVEPSKKKTEKSNQNYEQEQYDDFEVEERDEIRPETSSHSRRGEVEKIDHNKANTNTQLQNEGSFKRKERINISRQKQQEQLYQQQFPQQEQQKEKIPIIINRQKQKVSEPKVRKEQVNQVYQQQYKVIEEDKFEQEIKRQEKQEDSGMKINTNKTQVKKKEETAQPTRVEEKKAETTQPPKEEKKAETTQPPKEEKKAETTQPPKEEKKAEINQPPKEENKAELTQPSKLPQSFSPQLHLHIPSQSVISSSGQVHNDLTTLYHNIQQKIVSEHKNNFSSTPLTT